MSVITVTTGGISKTLVNGSKAAGYSKAHNCRIITKTDEEIYLVQWLPGLELQWTRNHVAAGDATSNSYKWQMSESALVDRKARKCIVSCQNKGGYPR